MLYRVEVKFEQMNLKNFAEDVEWSVASPFHNWGAKTEKSHNFAEWTFFALIDGGTSQPADVVERSARAGVCGLNSVWG